MTADQNIKNMVRSLITYIGDDAEREGVKETPERFLKAWQFWASGYQQKPEDVLKVFEDGADKYDELVFQGNIPMFSFCEHHLAPFFGVVHIGYIPYGNIVGLSKLARLVEVFARRLQVQERITAQIADSIHEHMNVRAVGVVLQCRHLCMESRGVQKIGTVTTTSALRGLLKTHPEVRSEFMSLMTAASKSTVI